MTKANATATAPQTEGGGLYRKILAVQQAIDAVPKRGYNSYHKYHYATEADILTVKETLNANGLVVLPTTLSEEKGFKPDGKSWASVTLLFRIVDVDSGDSVESQFTGYAEDNFDKAIYKATTGANKYFYLKFFGIATEDDPEREDVASPAARNTLNPVATRGSTATGSTPMKVAAKRAVGGTATGGVSASAASVASPSAKPEPLSAASQTQRNQALVNANKLLALQKQYGLSNDEVLRHGEIESVRDLAEAGEADLLAEAYLRLSNHVHLQKTS
jgi:hypothetical protein